MPPRSYLLPPIFFIPVPFYIVNGVRLTITDLSNDTLKGEAQRHGLDELRRSAVIRVPNVCEPQVVYRKVNVAWWAVGNIPRGHKFELHVWVQEVDSDNAIAGDDVGNRIW